MKFSGSGVAESNDLVQNSLLDSKYDNIALLALDEETFKKLVENKKNANSIRWTV